MNGAKIPAGAASGSLLPPIKGYQAEIAFAESTWLRSMNF